MTTTDAPQKPLSAADLRGEVERLIRRSWKLTNGQEGLNFMTMCESFFKLHGNTLIGSIQDSVEQKDRALEDGAQTFAGLMALVQNGTLENIQIAEVSLKDFLESAFKNQTEALNNYRPKEKKLAKDH